MSTALLVIDIQRGLFDEEPRPYEADEVVTRINALCRRGREQGAMVVYIQHERVSGNLEYGSESWQLEKQLQTAPTDYFIRKTTRTHFSEQISRNCSLRSW